jgi:hypothetical protein
MRDATREPADEDDDEDLAAVREAVAEWRAGDRGLPVDAAVDQVRRNNGAQGA